MLQSGLALTVTVAESVQEQPSAFSTVTPIKAVLSVPAVQVT